MEFILLFAVCKQFVYLLKAADIWFPIRFVIIPWSAENNSYNNNNNSQKVGDEWTNVYPGLLSREFAH